MEEKKIPVGQHGWAVVDENGDIVDVFMYEVSRNSLVLFDSEKIVEVSVTPLTNIV